MISRKELNYVDAWENKVPYPGADYSEQTMDDLVKCLHLFQTEYLNRIYNVTFSNNEEIEFQILEKNICHMLGINYKNLVGEYFEAYRRDILGLCPTSSYSSYDIINAIAENKDKILERDEKCKKTKAINYYRVAVKCAIFKKLADLSAFNYGCINFDKNTYMIECPERPIASNSTRFLYTPSDEVISPYYMMGLKQEEPESESYIVETLISPENVARLFKSQEVVIPTQIITDNDGELLKKQATPAEKIKLIKDYQALVYQYGLKSNLNIYGDYISQLMTAEKEEAKSLELSLK